MIMLRVSREKAYKNRVEINFSMIQDSSYNNSQDHAGRVE
jgi:hypothetical protein